MHSSQDSLPTLPCRFLSAC